MTRKKNLVSIGVAIVEDDVPAREILAGWIRSADGFKLVGEYDDAESKQRSEPEDRLREHRGDHRSVTLARIFGRVTTQRKIDLQGNRNPRAGGL